MAFDPWYTGSQGEINARKDFGPRQLRVPYLSLPEGPKAITVIVERGRRR